MGSMEYVEKNAIYLYGSKQNDIVWVGGEYHGDFLDKQFSGQYYSVDQVVANLCRKITLEEAVEKNLIKHNRFKLMNNVDKTQTLKIMLEKKGLLDTLNFLCNTKLDLSKEDLDSILEISKK